jgi:hypothetical protein
MVDPQPLASWNDGATKSAILDFVARVTNEGGAEFAPPAERIAAFDNDRIQEWPPALSLLV